MIKIIYENHEGYLDIENGLVYFYQFKYLNICDAIQNIQIDFDNNQDEIKLIDKLLENLFN